jgi:hypothetical protein
MEKHKDKVLDEADKTGLEGLFKYRQGIGGQNVDDLAHEYVVYLLFQSLGIVNKKEGTQCLLSNTG